MIKYRLLALIAIALLPIPVIAQGNYAFTETLITPDPAMHLAEGPYAVFSNPAAIDESSAAFSWQYHEPSESDRFTSAFTYRTSDNLALSLGVQGRKWEAIEEYSATGKTTGSFTPRSYAGIIGASYSLSDWISLGVNGEILHQSLSSNSKMTAACAGVFTFIKTPVEVGVNKIGTPVKNLQKREFSPPSSLSTGLSKGVSL